MFTHAKFTVFKPQIISWIKGLSRTFFKGGAMSFRKKCYVCSRLHAVYMLIGWHVNQSKDVVSCYTCASSSTIFILYRVARYSTYVPRVPDGVQFVHQMFTLAANVLRKPFAIGWWGFVFVNESLHSFEGRMNAALSSLNLYHCFLSFQPTVFMSSYCISEMSAASEDMRSIQP